MSKTYQQTTVTEVGKWKSLPDSKQNRWQYSNKAAPSQAIAAARQYGGAQKK